LVVAKDLGAKQVVVPWIFRISKLVQTMYIEIRDVETGFTRDVILEAIQMMAVPIDPLSNIKKHWKLNK